MKSTITSSLLVLFAFVLHAQNVGIGTTNPNSTLTVTSDTNPEIIIGNNSDNQIDGGKLTFDGNTATSSVIGFELSHNAAAGNLSLSSRNGGTTATIANFNSALESSFLYKMELGGGMLAGETSLDVLQKIRMRYGAETGHIIQSNSLGEMSWVSPAEILKVSPDRNICIGQDAGLNLAPNGSNDGQRNVFVGQEAGRDITSGRQNVYTGYWAGQKDNTGIRNVAIGTYANQDNAGGQENVIIGYGAGRSLNDSSVKNGNVFIGAHAGATETGSNKLYIESEQGNSTPLIYGDFATDEITINGDLDVTEDANLTGDLDIGGEVTVSNGVQASMDNTTSPERGVLYKNSGPLAYGRITAANSTITNDYGIATATKLSTGTFKIILDNPPGITPAVIVSADSSFFRSTSYNYNPLDKSITVKIYNSSFNTADSDFSIVVFGN